MKLEAEKNDYQSQLNDVIALVKHSASNKSSISNTCNSNFKEIDNDNYHDENYILKRITELDESIESQLELYCMDQEDDEKTSHESPLLKNSSITDPIEHFKSGDS